MKRLQTYISAFLIGFILLTAVPVETQAQCAMCTAAVTSNAGDEESELAGGLNTGIIYLFLLPYISFVGVAGLIYYGYRKKKKRERADEMVLEQTSDLPPELDPNRPSSDPNRPSEDA